MDFYLLNILYAAIILVILVLALTLFFVCFGTTPYPLVKRSEKEMYFYDVQNSKKVSFPLFSIHPTVDISVIVPAYNEEERLIPMLDECLPFLESRSKEICAFKYEVIIVSDGSKDKTTQVALQYSKEYGADKVRVLDLSLNRGKGGAVRLGVLSSRGSVILFADADGATKFSDLAKLEESLFQLINCDYIKTKNAAKFPAVVCGSRSHLEEESLANRSMFRTLLMHSFHWLVRLLAVRSIRDTQCGFKLFTRSSASLLFANLHVERWAFDVELLYLAKVFQIPTAEVAVNWTEIDGSKIVPIFSWLQMGRDLVLIWLRYKTGVWKVSRKI